MNQPHSYVPDSITCPSCGASIPITETLHHQLSEHAREELRTELAEEHQALAKRAEQLDVKELELKDREREVEAQVERRLAAEREQVTKEALAKARDDVSVELRDLQESVREQAQKLQESQSSELQLRKDKRDLEGEKRELELRVARTIDAERQQIRDAAVKEALEEHRLRDAEKDYKLQEARKANEELRRKLEQGSQQTQGEVLEVELEELLRAHCALDEILPTAKGVRGADVLQRVRTKTGLCCGSILWETKFTKNWSDGWIDKLRNDQREAKADVAVLVTDVLPKDVDGFGFKDGVWLTNPRHVLAVMTALRHGLVEVGFAKAATASKNETVDALFTYLTGPEFSPPR